MIEDNVSVGYVSVVVSILFDFKRREGRSFVMLSEVLDDVACSRLFYPMKIKAFVLGILLHSLKGLRSNNSNSRISHRKNWLD